MERNSLRVSGACVKGGGMEDPEETGGLTYVLGGFFGFDIVAVEGCEDQTVSKGG